LQIDSETSELIYEFEAVNSGGRDNQFIKLIRVMLLHPYKAFRIEDEFNISTGAQVEVRLHQGMAINLRTFSSLQIIIIIIMIIIH
jgi:uncharacterized protein with ParB-like and HNH nuclease domain